jgi:transcriptional regulator NrdR family protein
MKCHRCGGKTEVLETVMLEGQTRRRRRCLTPSCGFRFSTFEKARDESAVASEPRLPEWLENIRDRPGVDKEAIAAAYRVDVRRAQIAQDQKRRAREERDTEYEEDPPLTKEQLMRELRGY